MSIKKHYRSDTTETWSRLWYYMIFHNLIFQVSNSSTTHCPDSNVIWGLLYEITQDQCNLISAIKRSWISMRFWFCMQHQIQSLQQQQQHNSTLLSTQMVSMPQQQPPLGVVTSLQALSPASTPPIPPQNLQLLTPQSFAHQIPRQLSLSSTTSSSENGQ